MNLGEGRYTKINKMSMWINEKTQREGTLSYCTEISKKNLFFFSEIVGMVGKNYDFIILLLNLNISLITKKFTKKALPEKAIYSNCYEQKRTKNL